MWVLCRDQRGNASREKRPQTKHGCIKLGVTGVAQVSNLLYRGFPIRWSWKNAKPADVRRSAEWNSAIRQIGNLRYEGRRIGA